MFSIAARTINSELLDEIYNIRKHRHGVAWRYISNSRSIYVIYKLRVFVLKFERNSYHLLNVTRRQYSGEQINSFLELQFRNISLLFEVQKVRFAQHIIIPEN